MSGDDKEVVSTLRRVLADKVGQERFTLWFGSPACLDIRNGALVVAARDPFSLDRLRKHFRRELQSACDEVLGREVDIRFRLDPNQPAPEPDDRENHNGAEAGGPRAAAAPGTHRESGQSPSRARRLASLNCFVVGDGNRVAYTAAKMTAERLGAVTPLFIYGPTGCGKTHLLEGIWQAACRPASRRRAVLLSAEQFTSYFLEALRGSGLPSFRRRYRDLDLLLIDDVQFFGGKRATLVELQHTIDTLLRQGRQLVLSADCPPTALADVSPELITRMSGGLVCGIQPPDKATRLGIARRFCSQRHYTFPLPVLEWVAAEVTGDARQLSGALNRVQATSQALGQPITLQLAETALADLVRCIRPALHIADIERAVCDVFGLEPKVLQSERKSRAVSQPRMLAMWLARKYTRAAFSEIGHYFGRRSHSTVISAQKKVHAWMQSRKPIRLAHGACPVEDAIRRVEARLGTG